jgi:hypothetical protein
MRVSAELFYIKQIMRQIDKCKMFYVIVNRLNKVFALDF